MQSVEALIFMTGRNCAHYSARAVQSIARQTLKDVHILFVDDHSDDDTGKVALEALEKDFPGRYTLISNTSRFGKARNAWEHLRPLIDKTKFVGVVDADDQLIEPRVLEAMLSFYNAGKDVVWTNFAMDNGQVGCNAALDPNASPRHQGWKTSHFFSFRAELLGNVPEEYFRNSEGEWLQAACDIAIAMPILDQTRRYQFLAANAYLYTATNPQSHHNLDSQSIGLNSTIQQKCAREVFYKTPLPLTRPALPEAAPKPAETAPAQTNVSTSNRQAQGTAITPTQTWSDLTGNLVIAEMPGIINAMTYCGPARLAPEQVWALRGILSTRQEDANVLHVGTSRSALTLATMISGSARSLTCLCSSQAEAEELDLRLRLCAARDEVTITVGPNVDFSLDTISGSFPDATKLDADTKFEMVVVDLSIDVPSDSAVVSLSALAPHLAPRGFALCLMSDDEAAEAEAATMWSALGSGLRFCSNAIGGSGLLVIAG